MNRLNAFSRFTRLALLVSLVGLTGCETGNLFGKIHDSGDSNSLAVLESDAAIALDKKDYASALSLYERILAQNPSSAVALNGAAIAATAGAGLDVGTIVANIVSQSNSAPSVMDLRDAIAQARVGGYSSQAAGPNSLLSGIDLASLDDVIDLAICRVRRVATGATDGAIKANDPAAVLNLGFLCLLRAALRPIEANFFDIENVNGDYVLIEKAEFNTFCGNPAYGDVVTGIAGDLVGAYACFNAAANRLGLSSSSIVARIRDEMGEIIVKALNNDGNDDLPDACRLIIDAAGINDSNYSSNTDILTPPAGGC